MQGFWTTWICVDTGGSRISVREGAPNGKQEFERSREARQPCVARLKTSWGSWGRCKPPSGVWGSAPENFENQAFFLSRNGHFWLLSMNTSLAEVKRCFTNHVERYRSLLCGWRSTRRCRWSTRWSLSRSVQWPRFKSPAWVSVLNPEGGTSSGSVWAQVRSFWECILI